MAVLYIMFDDPAKNDRLYPPRAARDHMPFKEHRTQAEILESAARSKIMRKLGK